ncbi:MAG: hypothetical protein WBC78_22950 [Candidatus Sulfotelmatobacter sp.]
MKRTMDRRVVKVTWVLFGVLSVACQSQAGDAKTPYPSMAPIEQYLMSDRNAEIALARSAAPESISRDAEVLVLGRHGYETAVEGKNGFVCMVERSWTAGIEDPVFWDPTIRGAICLNPPAARTVLPITLKKTVLILAGRSKAQMSEGIKDAFDKKELPALEPGAMSYMMSRQASLGGSVGHWHPHLMFFAPETEAVTWGADLPGSPILTFGYSQDRLTVFLIPVAKWSDGTADVPDKR